MTYSGNLQNLEDLKSKDNYTFIQGDITDEEFVSDIFKTYKFDGVINIAAESQADRSISAPDVFAKTNILGTINLMNCFKRLG